MAKLFVWKVRNVAHIGEHNVSTEEARYVVEHAATRYPKRIGNRKYLVRGRTAKSRALQVIYLQYSDEEIGMEDLDLIDRMVVDEGDEVIYVIHARDLSQTEKRTI